jgi:hypothetical protein
MKVYVGMVTGHDGFYDVGAADTDADPINPHVLSILSKTGYNDDGTSYNMYRATCACGEWKSPPRHTYERAEEMGKAHLVAKGFPV